MKYYFFSAAVCVLSFSMLRVQAQYPIIPHAMEDSANAEMKKFQTLSDEAWTKALPIIEADEKKGKPFVLWAGKSADLPQANIPAFPGAEGGGAFTSGGRGGKVFVVKAWTIAARAHCAKHVNRAARASLFLTWPVSFI